jgi:hypothetical protein
VTHEETDPRAERLRAVVLARLLPRTKRPPTRSEVVASVSRCLHGATSEDDVRHELSVAIELGLVVKTPLGLSERGRETLRVALAVDTLPVPKDWRACSARCC